MALTSLTRPTPKMTDLSESISATLSSLRRLLNSTGSPLSHNSTPSPALGSVSSILNQTNMTESLHSTKPPAVHEDWQQIIIAVVLGIVIVGTIIGNLLVCISVAIVKRLQSPSNLLIVSLAVADLLVGVLVMPLTVVQELNGSWILGPDVCDMWTTIDVLLCTSSILNLCAISIDRYFAITRPFQYAMKRTPKRMGIMVLIVWCLSAVISIPPVFGWKSEQKPYSCFISDDFGYQIYATLGAFYLPLMVMMIIYFKIWRVSSKIARAEAKTKIGSFDKGAEFQIARSSNDYGDSSVLANGYLREGNCNGDEEGSLEIFAPRKIDPDKNKRRFTIRSLLPKHHKLSNTKERKATKTLGIIMGCFTLCWLPFFILALVKTFCKESCNVPPVLDSTLNWLGYVNSFLNPIIYARFNREFRTPFKEILLLRCNGINTRMRSESYVEQYGPVASHRDSLRPPTDTIVRYNSQGQTVVALGNGSANGSKLPEFKI